MSIIVLGSNGQLGKSIKDQFDHHKIKAIFLSRDEVNFERTEEIQKIQKFHPKIVINCAAYTNVDGAEKDKETCKKVNVSALLKLSEACKLDGINLIHISSDYVFDGNSNIPYNEDSNTSPNSFYGKSKLQGEKIIIGSQCSATIIRTSWVYSEYGNNFLKTMLKFGAKKKKIQVVSDQIGCPTYTQDLAHLILNITQDIKKGVHKNDVYHYCGDEALSWFDFATRIFKDAANLGFEIPNIIEPVSSSEYKTLAKRPAYSVLDCSKAESALKAKKSSVSNGIRTALNRLSENDQKL